MVIMLRVLRSSVSSVHRSPQTFVVIHSRNARSRSVALAFDRSTCSRPRTSVRTRMPSSKLLTDTAP